MRKIEDCAFEAVEEVLGISKEELLSSSRKRNLTDARFMVAKILSSEYDVYQIAEILHRARPSVLHYRQCFDNMMGYVDGFRTEYCLLLSRVSDKMNENETI